MTEQDRKLLLFYDLVDRVFMIARLGGLEDHASKCGCEHYVSELAPLKSETCSYEELLCAVDLVHSVLDDLGQRLIENSALPEGQSREYLRNRKL